MFIVIYQRVVAQSTQLYKTIVVRATPSKLPELIEYLKDNLSQMDAANGDKDFLLKHSQGDQWNLMLIIPIEALSKCYASSLAQIFERKYTSNIMIW